MGELYRMNLSCTGGGLPKSGCLFFKVLGRANVTTGWFTCVCVCACIYFEYTCIHTQHKCTVKFGCSVLGTIQTLEGCLSEIVVSTTSESVSSDKIESIIFSISVWICSSDSHDPCLDGVFCSPG